jgi:hypothetical protein
MHHVTTICNQRCVALWLDAADVCKLTYACPHKPNTRLSCRKPGDIGLAWKQCSGPANCKRMAFIFDYYGTEVCRRALSTTHQEATTKHIVETLGVVMDVLPGDMRGVRKHAFNSSTVAAPKTGKTTFCVWGGKNITSA